MRVVTGFVMLYLLSAMTVEVYAADAPVADSPQLQKCLKRADELPDIAAMEAAVWMKKNGGNDAHVCRAFAQANRGMHADAAREFWFLASFFDKSDAARAVTMHNLSGQEFLRAKDGKNADAQFASTLKIAPNNVDGLIGRARVLMMSEKYWDALDDLNRAVKIAPHSVDALRQRSSVWMHLGNEKNAQEDAEGAEALASGAQ